MTAYDEELHTLAEQTARLNKVRSILTDLQQQQAALTAREQELGAARIAEQHDVDQLKGRSLAAFFYAAIGKREEKLDKEQREAYAAAVKHDAVVRELTAVQQDIRSYEVERDALAGCEQRYAEVLERKREALKQQDPMRAEQILALEQRLAQQRSLDKEIGEAIHAGEVAAQRVASIQSELNGADGWGTFDLFGGGAISALAKHSHLDNAQSEIEILQTELRRFQTELNDVTIQADMQVRVDGFMGFADYFFDCLLVDWAILDHIHDAQEQIQTTDNQIQEALHRLRQMQLDCRTAQDEMQRELDTLIVNA